MPLTSVATYHRTVRASVARVWENVLDWEHLPWLHRTTFAFVRARTHGRDGWSGETALAWEPDRPLVIDVQLERAALRYHTRTVEGPGAGTDILTQLTPVDADTTCIAVEFLLPDVAPTAAGPIGQAYTLLYTRLWDEDETMMTRRQAVIDRTLPPECLTLDITGRPTSVSSICPHLGGPLAGAVADAHGCITCPWHGYRFDVRTGTSADGRGLALDPFPTAR